MKMLDRNKNINYNYTINIVQCLGEILFFVK